MMSWNGVCPRKARVFQTVLNAIKRIKAMIVRQTGWCSAEKCFESDKSPLLLFASVLPGGGCQPMEPPGGSSPAPRDHQAGPFPHHHLFPHARSGTAPPRKEERRGPANSRRKSASGSDDAGSYKPSSAERRRPELEVSAAADAGTFQRRR